MENLILSKTLKASLRNVISYGDFCNLYDLKAEYFENIKINKNNIKLRVGDLL